MLSEVDTMSSDTYSGDFDRENAMPPISLKTIPTIRLLHVSFISFSSASNKERHWRKLTNDKEGNFGRLFCEHFSN
jgi:hypothetical protein